MNCIAKEEDYTYFKNYEESFQLFLHLYKSLIQSAIRRMHEEK